MINLTEENILRTMREIRIFLIILILPLITSFFMISKVAQLLIEVQELKVGYGYMDLFREHKGA